MMNVSPSPEEETLTETLAFADLLTWAASRPAWQRDALRRLVLNGALTPGDVDDLADICLDPSLPYEPISQAHISTNTSPGCPIAILGIENPSGINALAAQQKLEFSKDNLTIVYGDNGSGKSGYVRVLKHACRTRDRDRHILRDVEASEDTPQSATIKFARGADPDEFPWTPDTAAHGELSSVSIFDSRSANVHVQDTNAVAYIPQPMQILETLATACDQLKAKLDERLRSISAQTPLAISTPKLGAATAAGSFLRGLTAGSNIATLELLAQLSEQESQRLAALQADLAQDPKRAATRLTAWKTRVEESTASLRRLIESSSDPSFAARDSLKEDRDAKAETARLAAEALFAASPLPDVGKETWKNLWEAARKYSDGVADPAKNFPVQTIGDLCVLCQQPLGEEAINRQMTFEKFIKGVTKAEDEIARGKYTDAITKARSARHRSRQ